MPDSTPEPAPARHTLVVLRHAKAEQEGPSDFERPLSPRGAADAAEAGSWMAAEGLVPDHALVSGALRTVQTWDALAAGGGWDLPPALDRGLYAADSDTALDLVRLLDDDLGTVVVVGHNPTMASLALLLDDGEGDPAVAAELATGFPTCALAVFSYAGSWADLAPGAATVTAYHVGRG